VQVDLRRVPFYWLNTETRTDRRQHMIEQLRGFIHARVDGSPSPLLQKLGDGRDHFVGAPLGHARVIDYALRCMGNTFTPFVLCEDDIAWSTPPGAGPVTVEFPEHAAAVYLGISACGVRPDVNDYTMDIVREQSSNYPQLQRVYNMLTAHAVLFLSMRYTMAYFAAMIESCATREPCDCISARLMATHQVFALGRPLFYQHGGVGGQEAMTKIAWTDAGHGGIGGAERGRMYHQMHPYCTLLIDPSAPPQPGDPVTIVDGTVSYVDGTASCELYNTFVLNSGSWSLSPNHFLVQGYDQTPVEIEPCEEGMRWIRGHHEPDSELAQALLAANALIR